MDVYNEDMYYEYTEFISKNNLHRFKDIYSKNKIVKAFAAVDSNRCPVKFLDIYFSLLPPEPIAFYLRALNDVPKVTGKPWLINTHVGINTLKVVLPNLSKKAGLFTPYTNHSLRATAATRIYTSDIPEKVIAETAGHGRLAGLRSYEHTTTLQKKAVTKTLSNPIPVKMEEDATLKENIAPVKEEGSCVLDTEKPIPVFSGVQNCTFNFYGRVLINPQHCEYNYKWGWGPTMTVPC